jgi:hypothetical protein
MRNKTTHRYDGVLDQRPVADAEAVEAVEVRAKQARWIPVKYTHAHKRKKKIKEEEESFF